MQNILEQLYLGNIGFDSEHYCQNSPFVKAARKKHDSMEKLLTTLDDTEKELFGQYCEAEGKIEGITRYNTYTKALKFGILLMVEVFISSDYCKDI